MRRHEPEAQQQALGYSDHGAVVELGNGHGRFKPSAKLMRGVPAQQVPGAGDVERLAKGEHAEGIGGDDWLGPTGQNGGRRFGQAGSGEGQRSPGRRASAA